LNPRGCTFCGTCINVSPANWILACLCLSCPALVPELCIAVCLRDNAWLQLPLTEILYKKARQAGTLDARVFSLQARRALLRSLDLIPSQYTKAAAQTAPKGSAEPAASPPSSCPSGEKQPRRTSGKQQAGGGPPKVRSAWDLDAAAMSTDRPVADLGGTSPVNFSRDPTQLHLPLSKTST
jgi:hypothetical protein